MIKVLTIIFKLQNIFYKFFIYLLVLFLQKRTYKSFTPENSNSNITINELHIYLLSLKMQIYNGINCQIIKQINQEQFIKYIKMLSELVLIIFFKILIEYSNMNINLKVRKNKKNKP